MNARCISPAHAQDQLCLLPNGIQLCYRQYGEAQNPSVLLIAGLGLQLTFWPRLLIDGLVGQGFHVVVFDNRDVGRSSSGTTRPPGRLAKFLRRADPAAYDLSDMADDARGLLDHLGIGRSHVIGMSMGGMIAQTLAARYPKRVQTLTSIFSSTGSHRAGQPAMSTMLKLARKPALTREDAVMHHLDLVRHIGPTTYTVNEHVERDYMADAWLRGAAEKAHEGVSRQLGAIIKSGNRSATLSQVQAPTLVIHGDKDLLVAPSGGRATARAIPGARMVTLNGMGHYLSDGMIPHLLDLFVGHARRSETC